MDEDECPRCQGSGVHFSRRNMHNSGLYDNRYTMCGVLIFRELEVPTVDHQAGSMDFCSCALGREQKFQYDHQSRKIKCVSAPFFLPFGNLERYTERKEKYRQIKKAEQQAKKDMKDDVKFGTDIW